MPLFSEIVKSDENKSGIASRLFVQSETKTFKTKVQLVNHANIVTFMQYFINAIIL